ncbi:phenylacetaldoxime dehydratase family protein [Amycolatopsis sp. NPDC049253]|uniref:phenylacetaldoxime dehydratase family protein n=1 Tax=Amycolatopsis sp. NPDC049253 TaxID=3155274 RepID=UPI00342E983A
MESSIAEHLRVDRVHPRRKPDSFHPPYPSFSARFDPGVDQVVRAYLGVQYRTPEPPSVVIAALAELDAARSGEHAPDHHDRARFVDEAGYATVLTTFYWTDPAAYERWAKAREAWTGPQHRSPDAGFFSEVVRPGVRRFETLFSSDRTEGVSVAADKLSGEIHEHGYWGGARDRLPVAQTDRLEPGARPTAQTDPETGVVTVRPQGNLCLIRSGQEWTETEGDERGMYLGDVEPVLRAGMEFLRDDGLGIGCYANRYVRVTDETGAETDKSYGMSWWHSLADLEAWAESHPTHVAIFRAAMKYLSTHAPAARLRLYHEVTVTDAGEQEFRYLGCHDRTGLLRAVR